MSHISSLRERGQFCWFQEEKWERHRSVDASLQEGEAEERGGNLLSASWRQNGKINPFLQNPPAAAVSPYIDKVSSFSM